jgi:HipA-like protein
MFVYKKNQLVGYLNFKGGQHTFTYDNDYLCQEDAKPVSPDIPLTDTVLVSERMFNVFEQVIPEGQDRKILEKQAGSANDFDLLPLLKDMGIYSFLKWHLSLMIRNSITHSIMPMSRLKFLAQTRFQMC